jgi:hypothetical protein
MYSNTADHTSSASSHRCWWMSSFLIVAFFSGNYMVWLPRNLPERGALRYLLHRGRERVIPGILNLPHPAGASRPGQPGANPQANTLNLRKNADHRPGVEYRRSMWHACAGRAVDGVSAAAVAPPAPAVSPSPGCPSGPVRPAIAAPQRVPAVAMALPWCPPRITGQLAQARREARRVRPGRQSAAAGRPSRRESRGGNNRVVKKTGIAL